jgi:metal-responsive CopG/Arc/MetJ family transcriptional regulator
MKTAISLPDHLFDEAETLAARLGKSRSQLYAQALAEYVARHDVGEVTRRLDRVLEEVGDETRQQDRAVTTAAEDTLRRVEW